MTYLGGRSYWRDVEKSSSAMRPRIYAHFFYCAKCGRKARRNYKSKDHALAMEKSSGGLLCIECFHKRRDAERRQMNRLCADLDARKAKLEKR